MNRLTWLTPLVVCLVHTVAQGQSWVAQQDTLGLLEEAGTVFWIDANEDGYQDIWMVKEEESPIHFYLISLKDSVITDIDSTTIPFGKQNYWAVGDLDNNLWQDFVQSGRMADDSPFTRIWFDNGGEWEGSFDAQLGVYGKPTVIDLDHNGKQDVLLAGVDETNDQDLWLLYDQDGGWEQLALSNVIAGFDSEVGDPIAVWSVDLNGDGWEELIVNGEKGGSYTLTIFEKVVDQFSYVLYSSQLPDMHIQSIAWGDYDYNGFPDLYIQGNTSTTSTAIVKLFTNENGQFDDTNSTFDTNPSLQNATAYLADISGDGLTDLVTSGVLMGDTLTLAYLQLPGGLTLAPDTINNSLMPEGFALGHYDTLGHLEIVSNDLWEIALDTVNKGPSSGMDLQARTFGAETIFNWEEGGDDNTPSPALTYDLLLFKDTEIIAGSDFSLRGSRMKSGPGKLGMAKKYSLVGLENGEYRWSRQAIDNAFWAPICPPGEECIGAGTGNCFTLITEEIKVCIGDSVHLESPWEGESLEWTTRNGDVLGVGTKLSILAKESLQISGWADGDCQRNYGVDLKVDTTQVDEAALMENEYRACPEGTIAISIPDNLRGDWYLDGELESEDTSRFAVSSPDPIFHSLIFIKETEYGCRFTDTTTLIFDVPKLVMPSPATIWLGESVELDAQGVGTWSWEPAETLSDPGVRNPIASPKENTTYTATLTSIGGCQNEGSVTVEVLGQLFVPQMFTPNGDGNNETFKLYGAGIEQVRFVIYDRDGRIVFSGSEVSSLFSTGWDGTYRGELLPPDTYTWVLEGRYKDGTPLTYGGETAGTLRLVR